MTYTSNKKSVWLTTALVTILTAVSAYYIYTRTMVGAELHRSTTQFAMIEAAVVFLWFFIALYFFNNNILTGLVLILTTYMLMWVHRIAVPVFVSGLYAAYLCVLGGTFRKLFGLKSSGYRMLDVIRAFLIGASLQIIIIAIPAALGYGGVKLIRTITIGLGIAAVIAYILICYYRGEFFAYEALPSDKEMKEEEKYRLPICIATALIATMVLMQIARINVTLDYDSLHYGLRSQYVVDNGRGFFENLGSVNDVYIYPKGLEILLLPICSDISYGYVLSFSVWMGIGVLALTFFIVSRISTRKEGLYATAIVSVIPAVMNLAISAKTDIATLFIQLIAVAELVLCDRETHELPVYAFAAIVFSYALKPTSFLFSTVILVVAVIYLLRSRRTASIKAVSVKLWLVILTPVVLAVLCVSARTMIMAGHPVASVGSSVWNALGLNEKYPYNATQTLRDASSMTDIKVFIKRAIGVFLCPVGDAMSHVIIAWGSIIPFISIVVVIIRSIAEKKITLLRVLLFAVIIASAICLVIIGQVDGNYFMLLYVLSVICFFEASSVLASVQILVPAMLLAIVMSLSTSWAGRAGVTTPGFLHLGFYDHESDNYNRMAAKGAREIYEFLDHDERYRVMSIAEQPECEIFRCNVQSYTDLEGSGGNVYLLKKLGYFKEFLDYAGIDYFYIDEEYLATREWGATLVSWMIEDGSLVPVIEGDGHMLYEYVSGR